MRRRSRVLTQQIDAVSGVLHVRSPGVSGFPLLPQIS